jgi:hypothetical protein
MDCELSIPDEIKNHPAWLRLEDQHKWYSKESVRSKKWYKALKFGQIIIAAIIPIVSFIDTSFTKYIVATFGATIAIVEGIQQVNQFHSLWIEYRSTTEHLKHEKYLFLSLSGPYRDLNQDEALLFLAERIEVHISKEHAKWINTSKKAVSVGLKKIEAE